MSAELGRGFEDPFGNRVLVSYFADGNGPADGMQRVDQYVSGNQVRSVVFTYEARLSSTGVPRPTRSLSSMTVLPDGRTWKYSQLDIPEVGYTLLTEVKPPAGPSWKYGYNTTLAPRYELTTVTTPGGGRIGYSYDDRVFYLGGNNLQGARQVISRAVVQRDVSGRGVPAGTWTYSYAAGNAKDRTFVNGPCSTTNYRFAGVGIYTTPVPTWAVGLMIDKDTAEGGTTLESEGFVWRGGSQPISLVPEIVGAAFSSDIRVPLVDAHKTTRGWTLYTAANSYRDINLNDFGRPFRTVESGDRSRTVQRVFQYGFRPYIVDRVASETVTEGSETFATSSTYDLDNGFKTSDTVRGITTTFQPDPFGNMASSKDANGHTTRFEYEWGVVSAIQTPEYSIGRQVNPDGTIASETRRGFTTAYRYDGLGRLLETDPPVGNPVSTTYDDVAATSTRTSRGPSSLTSSLDGFGRVTATVNTVGVKTETRYDACGRGTYQSYPFTTQSTGTTSQFDALGRVLTRANPDNTSVEFGYNGIDVSITDEEQRTTTQHWEGFGNPDDARLASVTDAAGQATSYGYNALGNLTSVQQPGAPARVWSYNSRGELVLETHPENGSVSYTYDAAGNLKTRVDNEFGTTTLVYDGNNRVTSIDRPGTNYDATIAYDASDNRTAVGNTFVASTFTYDGGSRLTSRKDVINGESFLAAYGYDGNDNLSSLTYPTQRQVAYTHDSENRITAVKNAAGTPFADSFAYHPSGAVTAFRMGNGIVQQFSFDNRYRVQSIDSGALRLQYGYDGVGNVTFIGDTRAGMNQSFGYDLLDRIDAANGVWGGGTFQYDANGNRQRMSVGPNTTSYAYDAATNRLATATGSAPDTFTYDRNGNLRQSTAGLFTYTPENLMEMATVDGAATAYRYDADNLRKLKVSGLVTTYYLHGPGNQILSQLAATIGTHPRPVRDYVYAGARLVAEIEINQPPVSNPGGPYTGTAGQPVAFDGTSSTDPDGTIVMYSWTFGDGATGAGPAPAHTYAAPGTYAIALTVTDDGGAATTANTTATIAPGNQPPVARPGGPYTGSVGQPIAFDGSASSDADGTIVAYAWNFGDGSTGTGPTPSHAYGSTGVFTVALSVTDNGGATASASSSATVGLPPNKPPVANPGGPYTGNAGDPVQFNGSGSSDPDGTITSYTWSFGDGTSGSGSTPTHVYASAATYPVTLTVTDDDGASTSASTSATVRPANSLPVANPGGPYTGTAGQPVQFDGSASSDSDGTIAGYAWDFGDGSTGAGPSPNHTYVAAAGYTPSLTVTDNAGGTNTATVEVSIAAPASALVLSPSTLSFTMPSGGSNPAAQTVGLSSTAGSLSWQATSSQPWLVLGAGNGTTPASLGVSVSGTGLSEGTRTGTITITADGATNGPLVISVEFVVQPRSGQGCLAGAWYCEPFDELSNGGLSGRAGWLTSDFSIATAQVVPDPRGTGKVLLFDPPVDDIINEGVNFADQPIEGSEISVQVMTLGTQPDDKQIAKIEFITLAGHAWGKTTRTFGAIRFGNGISLQYGPNITQTLVDTVDSNRWYALKVLYSSGAVYAYVDGVLRFSAPSYLESWLPVQGFGTTGWDFPGQGYLDVIQGRPAGPEVSNTPSGPAQIAEARVGSSGGIIALMLAGCLGFVSRSSRRRGWGRFLAAVAIVLLLPALSVAAETVRYYHLDAVGNVRAVSDQAGQVVERHDYLPFGEEWNPTGGTQPKRFTGKERDAETGLDYFGARYYKANVGRFTTVDPQQTIRGNILDPQRWNKYAYGRNNPLRFVDPDGRDWLAELILGERGRNVDTVNALFGREARAQYKQTAKEHPVIAGQLVIAPALLTGPLGAAVKAVEGGRWLGGPDDIATTAGRIAGGHAYDKHVTERGEFPDVGSRDDFADQIEGVMRTPSESKDLVRGRKAYWDDKTGTVVITNPHDPDAGTAFRPTDGKKYFDDKLQ